MGMQDFDVVAQSKVERRGLRVAAALVPFVLAFLPLAPATAADCVDYGKHMHWVASGLLIDDFYSAFDFGGIAIAGNHAYVAAVQYGLRVVDIEDRIRPRTIASLPAVGYAYDVEIQGQYAYVAANGLVVVDISDPASPQIVTSVGAGDPRCLALTGHYAWVTSWGSGITVVDIQNPESPVVVGGLDTGYSWGLDIAGDIACVANGDLVIVDVSQPWNPRVVATLETPKDAISVAISGSLALVFDESGQGDGTLLVIDIATPSSPRVVGSLGCTAWARGIVVAADRAYITAGGLVAIDIGDPAHPEVVGRAFGGHAVVVALADRYAYVVDGNGKVHVIDVASPESPPTVGCVATSCLPLGVALAGDRAYVAAVCLSWPHAGELNVIDVADPAHPRVTGQVAMPGWAFDVAVGGAYAYVVGENFFQVVEITDPRQPAVISSEPVGAGAIAVSGSYAFVNAFPGLQVVDISDPYDPEPVAGLPIAGGATDLEVVGKLAYVSEGALGLQIVDISDPVAPRIIGTATDAGGGSLGSASCVTVDGAYAYIADFESRLMMIDVTDPTHPVLRDRAAVSLRSIGSSFGPGMVAADGHVYLASDGLQVVDAGIDGQPHPLRLLGGAWVGLASRVALSDDHVFITVDDGWPTGALYVLPRQCGRGVQPGEEAVPRVARAIAYPNPTGDQTAIRLTLERGSAVSAAIYDVAGRLVRSLVRGVLGAGTHDIPWDGRDGDGLVVSSGLYLVRATTTGGTSTTRIVVLK